MRYGGVKKATYYDQRTARSPAFSQDQYDDRKRTDDKYYDDGDQDDRRLHRCGRSSDFDRKRDGNYRRDIDHSMGREGDYDSTYDRDCYWNGACRTHEDLTGKIFYVSHLYRVGSEFAKVDEVSSLQYIRPTVDQEHHAAASYLALMHKIDERRLKANSGAYLRYVTKSEDLEYGPAHGCLREMHYEGFDGVSKNHKKVLLHFNEAGKLGKGEEHRSARAMHFYGFRTSSYTDYTWEGDKAPKHHCKISCASLQTSGKTHSNTSSLTWSLGREQRASNSVSHGKFNFVNVISAERGNFEQKPERGLTQCRHMLEEVVQKSHKPHIRNESV